MNRCVDEVDFNMMQMWTQVHGLSMDIYTPGNAKGIGDSLGRCVGVEHLGVMRQRSFLRVIVEIEVSKSLKEGFLWVNSSGEKRWASV